MFQRPGQIVGHIDPPSAGLERGDDVGFERVADHHRPFGPVAQPGEDLAIDRGGFVRDDLDPMEELAQPRLRQFPLLVQKIALGDQHHSVALGHGGDGILGMGQKLDRVLEHLLARFDDLADDPGRDTVFGDLDGCFDHRQNEAFDAEAVVLDVALFRLEEALAQVIGIGEIGQELGESSLGHLKEMFVLPKGIIGIEADCRQICHHSSFKYVPSPVGPPFHRLTRNYIVRLSMHQVTQTMRESVLTLKPLMMSGKDDQGDSDSGVMTDTRSKTQRPPLYKVLLLNDDYTPMEFVVHVLERFFGMSHAHAFELMLTVHKKGVAVVGVFSFEIAETKVGQVMDFARRHQHPLQCTMEKE